MKAIFLLAILFLLASASEAQQNITWRPLLGQAETPSVEQRTPLGVRYIAYGFDKPKQKRIAKTVGWMQKRGVPGSLIEEYRTYALALTADRNVIPQMIDEAFKGMKAKYVDCGGKWKVTVEQLRPSQLLVKVEAAPVWSPHWSTYAVGLAWKEKNLIQAVNVAANGIMTSPKSAGPLRKFSDLVAWEVGNYFSMKAGHTIKTLADELGNASPCAPRPRAAALLSVNEKQNSSIIEP
jgi:hypothetical protein